MTKIFNGVVISTKMQKTAVVEVVRRVAHPVYKKLLRKRKKIKADVGSLSIAVGERVKIAETRPISKTKRFKIVEVIKK